MLWLVGVAWAYVVVMMTAAEATSDTGTLLGALVTFVLYGVLPLSIALYLLATPARRRRRVAADATASTPPPGPSDAAAVEPSDAAAAALDPHRGGHAAGHLVAPERIEP